MRLVRADQSAVIGINPSRKAEQETGRSVGARVVYVGLGGPSWSPAGWEVIVFLQAVSQGNRTRATIKAINAAPHRPSSALAPTEYPTLFRYVDAYEGRIHLSKCIIAPYISLWDAMNCAPTFHELRPYVALGAARGRSSYRSYRERREGWCRPT